jgi:hypothetical protein
LEGNYILSRFNLDGQHTKDVEGYLRLSENVLRYLLVKAEGPLPIPRLVEQRQSIDGDKREPEEVEASKEEGQTSVALIEEPPKEVEAPVEEDSTPAASWKSLRRKLRLQLRRIRPRQLLWKSLRRKLRLQLRRIRPRQLLWESLRRKLRLQLRRIRPRQLLWKSLRRKQSPITKRAKLPLMKSLGNR